jgi:hypothetical protein
LQSTTMPLESLFLSAFSASDPTWAPIVNKLEIKSLLSRLKLRKKIFPAIGHRKLLILWINAFKENLKIDSETTDLKKSWHILGWRMSIGADWEGSRWFLPSILYTTLTNTSSSSIAFTRSPFLLKLSCS